MLALLDIIRISASDPLWVTIALVVTRSVGLAVVFWWFAMTVRNQLRESRPSWPLSWPWCLSGWMGAIAVQILISTTRVLVVGHIRDQTMIGEWFRMVEIASAAHLAAWSIVAFWRWTHPLDGVDDAGVFATLAASMPMIVADDRGQIVYTTPSFEALSGYRGHELIGANLVTIIPERLRNAHRHGLSRFLATGESHIIGQVTSLDLLGKDGTETPIHLALATADVDGKPWFVGSIWRRTGAIERQQSARGERQDAREDALDVRSDQADQRGKQQDERGHDQDDRQIEQDDRDVIKQTAEDVQVVKKDVKTVRAKIVEGED